MCPPRTTVAAIVLPLLMVTPNTVNGSGTAMLILRSARMQKTQVERFGAVPVASLALTWIFSGIETIPRLSSKKRILK
jgi:hypothetical protein